MTGTGEGFHHNSRQKPIPEQPLEPEELFSGPSPLGSLEALRKLQAEKNAPAGPADSVGNPDDMSGSVFDDDDDEPGSLLGGLPDAIPNDSDGGTDILKSGRAELREFYERFSKASPPEPPDESTRPKGS
jgi:hypothetical protein